MLDTLLNAKSTFDSFLESVKTQEESYDSLIDSISSTLSSIANLEVTREILTETKVGVSVQKIAKEKIYPISEQAENVIAGWKKALDNQKNRNIVSPPEKIRHVEQSATINDYSGPLTNDPSRNKALSILYKAFLKGFPQNSPQPSNKVASELIYNLEQHVFESFHEKRLYAQQIKSIRFNLQDNNNTQLNYNLHVGEITPQQLATMAPQDMASEKLKRKREMVLKESMLACQSDWAVKNILLSSKTPGQFTCFKCKQSKTVYTQVQTRSSDEPMTTFVTCLVCQNRWKF
ncbi:transcription elongation factor S-II [Babesia microti strain RI]|uniref:Transcription elongation factor S-II n=1 Tax=Babesia microti (strain RI) TaxID=1133968 RepID=A0A1N6LWH8_BABMR|nr:transcription elongation factor S-II [Babesia microti strain RI]SIO73225.1 transcription elongation factor S-II [Babesia microti strain RI]|eukprot:XP_012647254.2 transcription elongation factor S-II [Babesia microti strain RI]